MSAQALTSPPTEALFHDLVDAVTDYAIFLLDDNGYIASWNAGAARLKGYTAAEAVGRHFSLFYTPEDRADGKPARVLEWVRLHGRYEEEAWRMRRDGSRFWANVVLTQVRGAQGELRGFAKVTRDLTERRQAEENERTLLVEQQLRLAAERSQKQLADSQRAAEAAARRAEESNQIKDEFLATVSHELRTPLNTILGWASLLCKKSEGTPLHPGLDAIWRNAEAQAHIVEDILDVARITLGKLKITPRKMDLVATVQEAIDVVQPSAQAKGISLRFLHEEPTAPMMADAERLRQVAWNMLSNAVKFTERGGAVEARVVRKEAGHIKLEVADTGCGIAADFLPYVFDRFRQAESPTTRRHGGLGLGLALVRQIVELHGGKASVDSQGLSQGATFTVALPVQAVARDAEREAAPGASPCHELARNSERLEGVKVVIVDDDQDARELLAELLTDAGAVVESADSAAAGFEMFRTFKPQVLISDIAMPDEDGYSLARRVRADESPQKPSTPLIALTAFGRPQDRTRALEAGFSAHVSKPVVPTHLVETVRHWAWPFEPKPAAG